MIKSREFLYEALGFLFIHFLFDCLQLCWDYLYFSSTPQTLFAHPRIQNKQWYPAEDNERSPYADDPATVAICSLRAEDLFVPESAEAEQADFVISVGGDSMEPTYHDGDKVFVEKCDAVDVGEVGIFVVNGDVYIKELGSKCLISHNEKYKPIRIGESDSVYCWGRVIGIV